MSAIQERIVSAAKFDTWSLSHSAGLPQHTDIHSNDDMEIKPINPIDSLETRSQSSLSEDLPVDASSTSTPPVRNSTLNISDGGALSSLGGNSTKPFLFAEFFFRFCFWIRFKNFNFDLVILLFANYYFWFPLPVNRTNNTQRNE